MEERSIFLLFCVGPYLNTYFFYHRSASALQCVTRAIKRPRTRSTAARQVSNAHERDLVTNQNVQFRPFLGQTYLLESLFFSIQFASSWGSAATGSEKKTLKKIRLT